MIFKSVVRNFYAVVVGSVFLLAGLGGNPVHASVINESDLNNVDFFGDTFAERYILPAGVDAVRGYLDPRKGNDFTDFFTFADLIPGSTFVIESGAFPGTSWGGRGPIFYDDFGVEIDLLAESWGYVNNNLLASPSRYTVTGFITAGGFINIGMPADNKDPTGYYLTLTSATVVPLPASLWLFVSGLTGLIVASRRKVRV